MPVTESAQAFMMGEGVACGRLAALLELERGGGASAAFPELWEPVPVYLDLEESDLAAVATAAGHEGPARDGLREAIRGVTVSGSRFSLSPLWQMHQGWRAAGDYWSPPTLAFLALTVLAAEDMGNSADGFDPLNYYSPGFAHCSR